MLVVLAVDRAGEDNIVTAEFLDSREGETTTFSCRSELPILEAGDFITMKGDQVSFVHQDSLWPVTFTIGGTVAIPEEQPPDPSPAAAPARAETPTKGRLVRPFEKKKQQGSWGPMTEPEMIHFNSDAVGLGDLFAKLEPIVKAYAREHTRKPPDVSRRLNAEGHRTAAGDAWTPRLVRFLLALMFDDSGRTPEDSPVGSGRAPRREPERPKRPTVAMDDKDEIARRLSSLGRVTMTKNTDRRRDPEQ